MLTSLWRGAEQVLSRLALGKAVAAQMQLPNISTSCNWEGASVAVSAAHEIFPSPIERGMLDCG